MPDAGETLSQEATSRRGVIARLDFPTDRRQPSAPALVLATLVALGVSLALDAALVHVAETLYPSTRHFAHFRPSDYGLLTTVGVLGACATWPVVTRLTSTPRWMFRRLAVAVTLVLYVPDLYILSRGEPARAVGFLMAMHLGIAVLTYEALVQIARVDGDGPSGRGAGVVIAAGAVATTGHEAATRPVPLLERRRIWVTMALLIAAEVALGVAALFVLPSSRPSGLLPSVGTAVYLLHAAVGAGVVIAAGGVVIVARRGKRGDYLSALTGAIGLAVAGIGGFVAADHAIRLLGMALMFVGGVTGVLAFGLPAVPATKLSDYAVGPLEWENRFRASGEEVPVSTDQWGHPIEPWGDPDGQR